MRWSLAVGAVGMALFAQQIRDLSVEPARQRDAFGERGTRWGLVVGISSYRYLPPEAQLRFAHRDAQEFAAFLRGPAGGAIPADHVRLLANEQATLAQIRAALEDWLADVARPEDIIYVFFAGHGVLDPHDDGYFVANDSDPQNLHATALPFREVDDILSNRLKASLVVLIADACHAGRLGWSSYAPDIPSRAAEPLASIGHGDRSFLKLLASRPSEQSFEDAAWNGGHGMFTRALLNGLEGAADRDGDRVVRAAETIDYVSRRVPELTDARQHPRVAGTFDGQTPLALSMKPEASAPRTVSLNVSGPAASAVYVDNVFRGRIRPEGMLRIDELQPGRHMVSADLPDGTTLQGSIAVGDGPARVSLAPAAASPLAQLRGRIDSGRVLEPDGAWEFYHRQTFPAEERAAASAMIGGALEELGQACVVDYVQSTSTALKRAMLQRAVDAYDRLHLLRRDDESIETRRLFCLGRLEIAENRFAEAVATLETSIKRDPGFACSYNALGVALSRMNRPADARRAFEMAARLTPEWALPPFQIASQLMAAGQTANAVPYLEKAVAFNPRALGTRWSLMHANRLLGRTAQAERQAAELVRIDPNYPPTYFELGLAYEAAGNYAKAADAYDAYVLLAPNYADSATVRARAARLRAR
jgi:tetratricopeptide (TPR) repeat protein